MDFMFPYSESKLKPYLKMAVQRIQIHNNKKTTAVKIQKKEVAQLLADGKDEKAKIRAEHIIRDDFTIEGLELLELNLELIHERIKQISTCKECPADMREAVSSVIWAQNHVDVTELKDIASQLTKKFGSKFADAAMRNEHNEVNIRLSQKLTYRPPSKMLVRKYLEEIAKVYDVEWQPVAADFEEEHAPFASPSGSSIPMAPGSGLTNAYSRPPGGGGGGTAVPEQNPVAPHLRLNEAEIEEYQQFVRNQSAGRAAFNPTVPPPADPSRNNSARSNNNNNNNNNNGGGGGGGGEGNELVFVPFFPPSSAQPPATEEDEDGTFLCFVFIFFSSLIYLFL
jgi:hypothetical protein